MTFPQWFATQRVFTTLPDGRYWHVTEERLAPFSEVYKRFKELT